MADKQISLFALGAFLGAFLTLSALFWRLDVCEKDYNVRACTVSLHGPIFEIAPRENSDGK